MRPVYPFVPHFRRLYLVPALFAAIIFLFVVYPSAIATAVGSNPQKRSQKQARRRVNKPAPVKQLNKYSTFTHKSHGKDSKDPNAKDLKCVNCHTIPSANEPDRIGAATKPNVVVGYPYHDSCFRCHRKEVYRGDRPVICTVCHTRVSPRITSRDVYSQFPSPKRGDIMAREFPGFFPHGLHQRLMAYNRPRRSSEFNAGLSIQHISFRAESTDVQTPKPMDICATCHVTDKRGSVELPLKGIPGDENFKSIGEDTFKTIPGDMRADGHAYCFNCHWQAQKPTKDECDGCHLSQSDYTSGKQKIIKPPALSPDAIRWFENWPTGFPRRFSLKFRHDTHSLNSDGITVSNNHDVGCTACHINITEMTTLNIPKADVQITSCAPCHTKFASIPVGPGIKVTIFREMALKGESEKSYTCTACHTSVIGRQQPPCSHYSVIGEQCPKPAQARME